MMADLPPVLEHESLVTSAVPVLLSSAAAKMAAVKPMRVRVNGFDDVPRPFFIGVAGGTASGKSSVCRKIMEQLGQAGVDSQKQRVVIVSMEDFYRPLTPDDRKSALCGLYNFDHPDAFDEELIISTLKQLKAGKTVQVSTYDAANICHNEEKKKVYPTDVIIFEGLLAFYFPSFRSFFNMKLFVDTDADTRLSRRVMRDMKERGRELDQILHQYTSFVKPAFEEFCLPTKKYADVIIPRGADNIVAIDLIVQSVQDLLKPNKERAKRVRHNSDSLVSRPH